MTLRNSFFNSIVFFIRVLIFITILFCGVRHCFAEGLKTGKIDLSKVLILHPKMFFFDYDRLGFYKEKLINNFGYTDLNTNTNLAIASDEIKIIKYMIRKLNNKLSQIPPKTENKNNSDEIEKIQLEINDLKNRISDIEFEFNNADLTNISETRKILLEIKEEVLKNIKEVASEQNLTVVFNDSDLSYSNFPSTFIDCTFLKNNTISGFDNPYYIFLTDSLKTEKSGEPPSSVDLSNWLEYARDPGLINLLPLKHQNFVVFGAEDILLPVMKKIYLKNNISLDVYKKIELVLKDVISENKFLY